MLASGSVLVNGTILPFFLGNGQRGPGSFLLTLNPSSLTLGQGTSASSTVTVMSVNGFSGTVALSSTFMNGSLPVAFSNYTLKIPVNGTVTSTLTLTPPNTTATGNYNLVVTGTGTGTKRVLSSSALLSVLVTSTADYSIHANPNPLRIVAGSANSTSIILGSLNGFSGTVSLAAATPFGFIGAMGGQNPVFLSPGGTAMSSLWISTTTDTVPGNYTLTVTGTSGQRYHTSVITVNILPPAIEALVLVSFQLNSATNLTLTIQNIGNVPATLQQYSVRDSTGATWTLANWAGPVIAPNSVATANILIGANCSQCTYTGIFGFLQFIPGQTYTITVTTTRNNQFVFTVTP